MNSHIGSLLPVVVIVITWFLGALNQAKKKSAGRPAPDAGDEAERTRRVQEDVQRKIAERRRAAAPPPLTTARGASGPPAQPVDEEDEEEAVLQRQQRLAEQMRVLEEVRASAQVRAAAAASVVEQAGASSRDWLRELRDPQNARRGIVLREVLGPPVGLR